MVKTRSGYKKVKSLFGKYEDIPEEWEIQLVSKTQDIMMGQSPPSESYNQEKQGLPFYQGVTDFGYMYPNPSVWCTDPKKITAKDTILFSVRAPVGEVNITETQCCLGRGIAALNPTINDLMYCYYIINQNKKRFLIYAQGTTYDAINQKDISSVKLPHTKNILEQQKIASILSGVDALIESTQNVIEKAERLKKGLMQKLLTRGIGHTKFKQVKWLFGKEMSIPQVWKWSELGKEGNLSSGSTPRRDHPEYYKGNIPWVSSGELDYNIIENTHETITSLAVEKTNLKIHPKDTFLFAITGLEAKGTRGRCAILGVSATTNQSCMAFNKPNSLLSKFLFYYFLLFGEKIIFSLAQGTKQQSLNLYLSKKIKIPIPEYEEQQKIASILSGVDAYIQKNQQYKERLEKLKKGLMQKLLTGQIRVKV